MRDMFRSTYVHSHILMIVLEHITASCYDTAAFPPTVMTNSAFDGVASLLQRRIAVSLCVRNTRSNNRIRSTMVKNLQLAVDTACPPVVRKHMNSRLSW